MGWIDFKYVQYWWGYDNQVASWSIYRIFSLDVTGNIEEINSLTPPTFINPPTPISISPQLIFTHQPIFLLIMFLTQHCKIYLKLWLPLSALTLFIFNRRSTYRYVCTWKLCSYGFCSFMRKSSQDDELALFFHCKTNNLENFRSFL